MNAARHFLRIVIAAALLSAAPALFAADADSTFDIIQFKAPAGWQPADQPGQPTKVFLAPDSNPFQPAYIVIGLSPPMPNFDFRATFDNSVKAAAANGTIIQSTPATPAKTRQGFDAISQTFVVQNGPQRMYSRMVSAKVNDRMATFGLLASSQQLYDRHQADMDALLQSVSFNAPAPGAAPAPGPAPGAAPAAGNPAAEWAALEQRKQKLLQELADIDARQRQLAAGQVPAAQAPGQAPAAQAAADDAMPSQVPAQPATPPLGQSDLFKKARERFAKEADGRRKPHTVVGDILNLDGKPIPNVAAYSVYIKGTTVAAERTNFNLDVDQNGHFEQQLPDGLYRMYVTCLVDCGGHRVPLDLESLDGKAMGTDQSSDRGIVKDFRVVMDGVKAGENPDNPYGYYGGMLNLIDAAGGMDRGISERYPGSRVQFVFTPQGTLVDGSTIRPFTVTMSSRQIDFGNPRIRRLPLGHYTVTATLVGPQGQSRPLACSRNFQGPYATSFDLYWECSQGNQDSRTDPTLHLKD